MDLPEREKGKPMRIVLTAAVCCYFFYFCPAWAADTAKVCFNTACFQVEVAESQAEKQRGLMGRDDLPYGGGMLFIYNAEVRPEFWMKNMRMPLDFIWIDGEGKVVDLEENVAACAIGACPTLMTQGFVRYVLEIPAASIHKAGIKIGDQAVIQLGETP